ncbi:MAG: threonylcarbamoyl-AMP synthase [Planctomycetes bacterium]|nr:threonylcarbamoyl-AMP synthase [Planctomycetota bacterium]NUQ34343.1 threonylcarbamoyl-AMP synthase [Planctomycetaceae bacterium]
MTTMPDSTTTERAAKLLREGKLVAFATETVYGLGCNALDAKAVARVFEVKGRPSFDPLIVHVCSIERARTVATFNPLAEQLAAKFWPGPLTLVLPKKPIVPDIVTAGLDSAGVRLPAHPLAQALIEKAGVPVAAPSANPFGFVSPTRAEHVREQLGSKVEMILDGGPCEVGVESTVLSLLGKAPVILRHGGVTQEELEQVTGRLTSETSAQGAARSPGQQLSHYAPGKPLKIFARDGELPKERNRAGLLAFSKSREGFVACEVLSASGDMREAAANLFAALRRLGSSDIDIIYAEAVSEHGLGRAMMDRLTRAASKSV